MAKQTGKKSSKKAPLTEFDLFNLFNERTKLYIIDGELSYYNGRYFESLNDKTLETTILKVLRKELEELGSARKIKAVAYLIKTYEYEEYVSGEKQGLLGFTNGVLNFNNWSFWPFSNKNCPVFPITYCLPVAYDYNVHYQLVEPRNIPNEELFLNRNDYRTIYTDKFFLQTAGNDGPLFMRIYEMIGYILSPDIYAKAFFLLQGAPNTGKSVIGKFLEGYFPSGMVTSLDISRLGGQYLPDALATSKLNLSMDLPNGELSKKAVAMLKMLTGDDLVTHEAKYKDAKPYRGQCKFIFGTNHRLKLAEQDKAFLERAICIPFKYSVPKAQQDPMLLYRLNEERERVTMKALYFYRCYLIRNRQFSGFDTIKPEIEYHLTPNDTIKEFVTECCVFGDSFTYTRELHNAYLKFCAKNDYKAVASQSGFSQRLSALYSSQLEAHRQRDKDGDGENIRGFKGIQIIQPQEDNTNFSKNGSDQSGENTTQTVNV